MITKRVIERYNDAYLSHSAFNDKATRNVNFFAGDGRQWESSDVQELICNQNKKPVEINEVLPKIMALYGYSLNNKMDIDCMPEGESDGHIATILTKIIKNVLKQNDYDNTESQVILDGLLTGRGYLDIRMDFSTNLMGDIKITTIDPKNVIPDQSASTYNPKGWGYVIVKRWVTYQELVEFFGTDKANSAIQNAERKESELLTDRTVDFAGENPYYSTNKEQGRYLLLDMQEKVVKKVKCIAYQSGDYKVLTALDLNDGERMAAYKASGGIVIEKMATVVMWYQVVGDTVLHEAQSPYQEFTVIPYFPLFMRGMTLSPIDNLINPQELRNKVATQILHHVNSITGNGWFVEQGSLTNMDTEDLEKNGSKPKYVVEYAKGSTRPEKINAQPIPQGLSEMLNLMELAIDKISGIDERQQNASPDASGESIKNRQFFSMQGQAPYLESISYTRSMIGKAILRCIREYYDNHRVYRITEQDTKTGVKVFNKYEINIPVSDGNSFVYLNDITIGNYDVIVTSKPSRETFEESQFRSAIELLQAGVTIPPEVIVKHSNLSDKEDIIQQMNNAKPDPVKEAVKELKLAQAELAKAKAMNTNIEGVYSATTAAALAAQNAQIAPTADSILQSVGFVDKNGGQAIDNQPQGIGQLPSERNNNPLTPPNPTNEVKAGIENGSGAPTYRM